MTQCYCYCHRTYDDCYTDCCKQAKETERRDREWSAKYYEEKRIREEQNQKLQELIEKRIKRVEGWIKLEEGKNKESNIRLNELQKLLKESKK